VFHDAQLCLRAEREDRLVIQSDAGATTFFRAHQVIPDNVIALLGVCGALVLA